MFYVTLSISPNMTFFNILLLSFLHLGLHLPGLLSIGRVCVLQQLQVLFALRHFLTFQMFPKPSVECHVNVCNILEEFNQSLFMSQKTVCISIFMCLEMVSKQRDKTYCMPCMTGFVMLRYNM